MGEAFSPVHRKRRFLLVIPIPNLLISLQHTLTDGLSELRGLAGQYALRSRRIARAARPGRAQEEINGVNLLSPGG